MEMPKLLRMDTNVRSTAIDEKTDHIRPLQRSFTDHDLDLLLDLLMLGITRKPWCVAQCLNHSTTESLLALIA